MSDAHRKPSRLWSPEHYRQEAHSPAAKVPADDLGFFWLDTVPHLDLSRVYAPSEAETRGAPPLDPQMMVCLWRYASGGGVFSSRKIAQACERNLAFLAIVGEDRPDCRTMSDVRTLHLQAFGDVFVEGLRLAGEAGVVPLGHVATEGTTLQGNAARHQAMS